MGVVAVFDRAWSSNTSAVRKVPAELLGLLLGSAVVLIAATYEKRLHDSWTWGAVICSTTSLVIVVLLLLALGSDRSSSAREHMQCASTFLAIWWLVGTGCMTFKSPFVATSNGY